MSKFEPRDHLISIKNGKGVSEYLEVKWRLVWYRDECPEGEIKTEVVLLDLDKEVQIETYAWNSEKRRSEKVQKMAKGVAVFRATVTDGKGASATGTKSENAANFPDFIEKAESGAIGRALAALGYGTQFTGDELDEKERIVDSPVDRSNASASGNATESAQTPNHRLQANNGVNVPAPRTTPSQDAEIANARQKELITNYCRELGYPLPINFDTIPSDEAARLINKYHREYKQREERNKAS